MFEGERIENLARTTVYQPDKEDSNDPALSQSQDEYVLAKLFKKSGKLSLFYPTRKAEKMKGP